VAITVAHTEFNDTPYRSPTVDESVGRVEVTRYLKCAWADRFTLATQLMGGVVAGVTYAPAACPDVPAATCKRVRIEGFGGPTGDATQTQAVYSEAILQVFYATQQPGDPAAGPGGLLYSEQIEGNARFLTMPHRNLYWADGSALATAEAPAVIFRGLDWVFTRYNFAASSIPAWVFDLQGCVNDAPITSWRYNRTFAAGTLMYGTPLIATSATIAGSNGFNLTLRLSYQPQGWNNFPRHGQVECEPIYVDDAASDLWLPYPPASFGVIQS
jgi:hypothetical protein